MSLIKANKESFKNLISDINSTQDDELKKFLEKLERANKIKASKDYKGLLAFSSFRSRVEVV